MAISSTADLATTTDARGAYTLTNLLSGTYAFTPTMRGFTFSPSSHTVSVPPDRLGVDFVAFPLTYTVSGRVVADGEPLVGVILSSTAGITETTDAGGVYAITGMLSGTYTVTPALTGYAFDPAARTVSVPPDLAGIDFEGQEEARPWHRYLPIALGRE